MIEKLTTKIALVVCLLGSSAVFPINLTAQSNAKKTTAPAPRTASAETTIPVGAVKSDDGNFRYTDKDGKKWVYRQTPFGLSRYEDKPQDATVTPFGKSKEPLVPTKQPDPPPGGEGKQLTVAYDEGDTIRFERPTPFGLSVWRKKKSELDASDQKIIDEQLKKKQ